MGPGIKHTQCYGLLLKHLKSSEIHWLHPDLTMTELTQRYEQEHLEAEWRSECRADCGAVYVLEMKRGNVTVNVIFPDMT